MFERLIPASNPFVDEKIPDTGPDSLYVLQIQQDVRPILHGPFTTYEETEACYQLIVQEEGEDNAGAIFSLLLRWPESTIVIDSPRRSHTELVEQARRMHIAKQYRPTPEQLDEEARYL